MRLRPSLSPRRPPMKAPAGGTDRIRADRGENPDSAGAHSERRLPHRKPGSERHNRSGIEVRGHARQDRPLPLLLGDVATSTVTGPADRLFAYATLRCSRTGSCVPARCGWPPPLISTRSAGAKAKRGNHVSPCTVSGTPRSPVGLATSPPMTS
jgi:hypothetical protein